MLVRIEPAQVPAGSRRSGAAPIRLQNTDRDSHGVVSRDSGAPPSFFGGSGSCTDLVKKKSLIYRTFRLDHGADVPNDLSSFSLWPASEKALSMGRSRDHRRFYQDFFKNSLDKPLIH
jgi:hypothetical protein